MPAEGGDEGVPQGLSWSWELDFDALMDSLGEAGPRRAGAASATASGTSSSAVSVGDHAVGAVPAGASPYGGPPDVGLNAEEAVLDDLEDRAGVEDPRGLGAPIPAGALAGRVAERLVPGPDLVAWLAMAPAAGLADGDLAVVAGSWRRIACWAQAQELAAVAQIASRAAAREEGIGTDADGRPARVPAAAAAEVALELTMSQYGASWWAELAVDLCWRLAATGAALAAGVIDLSRARLIAEATGGLSDAAARAVEERVLPAAGGQTTGMLRAALRRAVIAADPQGAERRREQAERQARVGLYPDAESTATLAGQRLPGVHAAAAMARIKAMARAWQTSGAAGGIDLLCAKVFLGLLLGTLPLIPPAEDAPPDGPPGSDPGEDPGGAGGPGGRGESRGAAPRRGSPAGDGPGNGHSRGHRGGDGPGGGRPRGSPGGPPGGGPCDDVPCDDVPPPGDQDAPRDDDPCPAGGGWDRPGQDDNDDASQGRGLAPAWPALPAVIPSAFAKPEDGRPRDGRPRDGRRKEGRPAAGLLDVSMPWQTLAGTGPGPGHLGRIGPLTALQARRLAECAARDPAAEWRIIVTTPTGHALAVTRIHGRRGRDGPPRPTDGTGSRPGSGIGLVGRVTLTIPDELLSHPPPHGSLSGSGLPGGILARALQAAADAAARARASAAADAAAGGCAHDAASPGYRPPPRLRDHVVARDLTCRFPRCQQPAWRGDLDHTIPFDDGGLTCRCNLGGLCRTHHIIKHHPGWKLEQIAPGIFRWTTPSGRTFMATPDTHPL